MAGKMFKQLGLIGCGLMGGSFALALKRAGLVDHVVGYSKSPSTTEKAKRLGVIDTAAESALLAVSGSDIVLIAVPVAATEATLRAIHHLVVPGVLFMDVGSTKGDVVECAQKVLKDRIKYFVPAHPIAGKETAGIEHADPQLFAGRHVILTPTDQVDQALVQKATDVWSAIGSQVLRMRANVHDTAFAAVSHLPHLLAFAYMEGVMSHPSGKDFLALAGPGFRDFSRIAGSDPAVWRDILIANREEILRQSTAFRQALDDFEALMCEGDAEGLSARIKRVAQTRNRWQMGQIAVPKAEKASPAPAVGSPAAKTTRGKSR